LALSVLTLLLQRPVPQDQEPAQQHEFGSGDTSDG
jgi:hypothetical protein